MANKAFQLPIRGYSLGLSPDKQPPLTTGYMDNIFPRGQLEKWIRLVQRPGNDKKLAAQIAGAFPVVILLSVTTVD
jgi:hypothetical protein